MRSPFLYLTACSVKNRVIQRVRRLRQPRYLAGLIIGSLYLYLVRAPQPAPGWPLGRGRRRSAPRAA